MSFTLPFVLNNAVQQPTQGGTGISSYTTGDITYASDTNVLSKLAAASSGNALISGTTPSWGKIALTTHVSGVLPVANGGTAQTTFTNGQLLIGNSSNGLTKATLTAGSGISITNGDGSISIAASLTGQTTVYDTPGSYTYNIPASARFLHIVLCGSGGSGAKAWNWSSNRCGGGGGAAMTRILTIPVDGATTLAVVVAAGAAASADASGANGNDGTESTVTINGKTIYAYGGGGGRGPTSSSNAGQGGGAAGSGGGAIGAAAGPETGTLGFYAAQVLGLTGGLAATASSAGTMVNPSLSSTSQQRPMYFLGSSGGGGAFGSFASGGFGFPMFISNQADAPVVGGGGQGGCSYLAKGGSANATASTALTKPGPGAGSAGGCWDNGTSTRQQTAAGGDGYCAISWA